MINIHYAALRDDSDKENVSNELLKKAQGFFGSKARQEIVRILDPHLRKQAMEVARREVGPQLLYDAGVEGLLIAVKSYKVGHEDSAFKVYSTAFIRQAMQKAKTKLAQSSNP